MRFTLNPFYTDTQHLVLYPERTNARIYAPAKVPFHAGDIYDSNNMKHEGKVVKFVDLEDKVRNNVTSPRHNANLEKKLIACGAVENEDYVIAVCKGCGGNIRKIHIKQFRILED